MGQQFELKLICLLLWILVMASSLAVIYISHKNRVAIHELETLRQQTVALRIESGRYALEKSTFSSLSRVESIASEKLNMVVPKSENIVVLEP